MDWIIQFDPPDDPRDYIHRVGRTARGANGKGRSLLFLQPSEVGFLRHLKEARVPVVEFEFPAKRIVNVQSQLEKLIGQNYYLNKVGSSWPGPGHWSRGSYVMTDHPTVRQRWLSLVPPGIRVSQSTIRLRRTPARPRQGGQELWLPSSATGGHHPGCQHESR